jgi:two-component system, NarL family, sensor histidine kinase YdfH
LEVMGINPYIWLFFFYGLAFFTLGTSALQQKMRHSSEFPLMRWIHLLGLFGILQAMSEWMIMLRVTGAYLGIDPLLYLAETFLSAFSFAYLLSFGIALIVTERLKHLNLHIWIPWMIFMLWCFFYFGHYYVGPGDSYSHIQLFNQLSRYLLGFPGSVLAGSALFINGRQLKQMKLIRYARLYYGAGALFICYGITAGIVISLIGVYPAVINHQEPISIAWRLPIEFFRAGAAIGITILTIRLFDSFIWEMQQRLNDYSQQQLILKERKKTIRMVHDQIIQRLFGAGMHIENMMELDAAHYPEHLRTLKEELNQTILEARSFLQTFSEPSLIMEDFQDNLQNLIDRFKLNNKANLDYEYHVPPMVLGRISAEKNTQLYYIIQEALINIQKHSKAQNVKIIVNSTLQDLVIRIIDDGVGITLTSDSSKGFGIQSMKERADNINAEILFERRQKKTVITIMVPWEER